MLLVWVTNTIFESQDISVTSFSVSVSLSQLQLSHQLETRTQLCLLPFPTSSQPVIKQIQQKDQLHLGEKLFHLSTLVETMSADRALTEQRSLILQERAGLGNHQHQQIILKRRMGFMFQMPHFTVSSYYTHHCGHGTLINKTSTQATRSKALFKEVA